MINIVSDKKELRQQINCNNYIRSELFHVII